MVYRPLPLVLFLSTLSSSVTICASPRLAAAGEARAPAIDAEAPPWRARRRAGLRYPFRGFATVRDWGAEPASPPAPDAERFAGALRALCGPKLSAKQAARHAGWMLRYGRRFEVDPFLLAALSYRRSRCNPRFTAKKRRGKRADAIGLLGLSARMHRPMIADGRYRYFRRAGTGWRREELAVDRFPLTARSLRRAEVSIYFGAALLSIYRKQCREIDRPFGSKAHRHHVSHLVFGDRVLGARAEDFILQARRRALGYYSAPTGEAGRPGPPRPPRSQVSVRGVRIASPLDGTPRRISSPYRARRGRKRRHRGVDFYSTWGEPVRAVADGVVYFAGVQPRGRKAVALGPARGRRWPRRRMGIGGLFVLIAHARGVESRYFHLARYVVRRGGKVRAGQIIGYVGRTGIKSSPTHLHFEMRRGGRNVNPTPYLRPHLIWPGKRPRPIG